MLKEFNINLSLSVVCSKNWSVRELSFKSENLDCLKPFLEALALIAKAP
jgi:hypothetical protein